MALPAVGGAQAVPQNYQLPDNMDPEKAKAKREKAINDIIDICEDSASRHHNVGEYNQAQKAKYANYMQKVEKDTKGPINAIKRVTNKLFK